jgi:predicted negative regulator of RcsB-dependent stress response
MEYAKKYWWLIVVAVVAYIIYEMYVEKQAQPAETELSRYQKLMLDISRQNPGFVSQNQVENLKNLANSGNLNKQPTIIRNVSI